MDCVINHNQARAALKWRSAEKVNWSFVKQVVSKHLFDIFVTGAPKVPIHAGLQLMIWCQLDEIFELVPYWMDTDGTPRRLTDLAPVSSKDFDKLTASFEYFMERLEDNEEEIGKARHLLLEIVTQECALIQAHNFYFPSSTNVTYRIGNS